MESLGELLQFVNSSIYSIQQTTRISENLPINLYNELYSTLEENTLGKRLKKARLKLGLSQYALAAQTGLTRNSIDNYERDTVHPSVTALKKLITVIDKDYLCNDEYYKFILSDYPNIIKNWRKENRLSLRSASKILEIGATTLCSWENELYTISKNNFKKLKKIL